MCLYLISPSIQISITLFSLLLPLYLASLPSPHPFLNLSICTLPLISKLSFVIYANFDSHLFPGVKLYFSSRQSGETADFSCFPALGGQTVLVLLWNASVGLCLGCVRCLQSLWCHSATNKYNLFHIVRNRWRTGLVLVGVLILSITDFVLICI